MQIFITDLKKIINRQDFISVCSQRLCKNDFKRFQRITNEHRALQFLVGRMLISEQFGTDFEILPTGKIVSSKGYLSLAHSNRFVVLATDDNPIGIDIEKTDETRDFQKMASRMNFGTCQTPKDFYKKWTAYEADFKLGLEFKNPKHQFIEHEEFIICISSLTSKTAEIIERKLF